MKCIKEQGRAGDRTATRSYAAASCAAVVCANSAVAAETRLSLWQLTANSRLSGGTAGMDNFPLMITNRSSNHDLIISRHY